MPSGLEEAWQEEQFFERLAETIAWCSKSGDPANAKESLRNFEPEYCHLTSQESQVFKVCMQRWDRLRSLGEQTSSPVRNLAGGRLLAYFPDENLAHGISDWESNGFFDGDNIPPFDTWLWFERATETFLGGETRGPSYLVAWVPPDLVELANRGIEADPMPCIFWLDTLDTPLVESLKRLGLLGEGLESAAIVGGGDAR